jgi:hypothetical protein
MKFGQQAMEVVHTRLALSASCGRGRTSAIARRA